ncbi:MAG: hypothetical protein JXA99_07375 [Candidatus Lokiarchaeota archaeon]|nr:hypothetical protein [Candidatus Lokiarchaeota archaeon]
MKKISGNPYLSVNNNEILIDQIKLNDLLKKYQTPFMIFIENRLKDNIKTFNHVFNDHFENFKGYYSVKANFLSDICKLVNSENFGAEIISLPELKLCLNCGFKPEDIIIGGPYLSENLIRESISKKVSEIIVYDLDDIEKIDFIAKEYGILQDICIRINSMKYMSKLGVNLSHDNIKKLSHILNKSKNVNFSTITSHYGSQLNNVNQYLTNLDNLIEVFKLLKQKGFNIKNLNLGGGFPEASIMPKKQLELIALEIKNYLFSNHIDYDKIIFEPGRYLVGDTGVFISEIIKTNDDRWIFLNIGNHICPKFARCSLRFYNATQIDSPHKYKTSIAGIIPTDQDVLAKNYFFSKDLSKGDHILITNVGAYCLTFSNRFPYSLPIILSIKNNEFKEIFNPNVQNDFSLS